MSINHITVTKIIKIIDAVKRFQEALGDSIDAEVIRACFRKIYAEILSEEAITFDADYILQGSLATDFIESGARGEAIKIKTHHNIGLELSRPQLHPLEDLFKYEVRELALTLGLPEEIAYCHPFPGPGLYIRTPGVPATLEILEIARWANTIATRILKEEKIYDGLSQLVVGLWGLKTTGVAGDERKYEFSAVVRAVITADFMTAQGVYFEERVFRKINREIVKHPRIVRCLLDPTDKPPATTEFQ